MQDDGVSFLSPGGPSGGGELGGRGEVRPEPGFTACQLQQDGDSCPGPAGGLRSTGLTVHTWVSLVKAPLGPVSAARDPPRPPPHTVDAVRLCWQGRADFCSGKSCLCTVCLGPLSEVSGSCDPLRGSRACSFLQNPMAAGCQGRPCVFSGWWVLSGLGWGPAVHTGALGGSCCQALRPWLSRWRGVPWCEPGCWVGS